MKACATTIGLALVLANPLGADTNVFATDPVGVLRYIFQANSDSSMSLPLHRPTEFAGAVDAVGSDWITAAAPSNSPINWVNNDWVYGVGTNANNTYYAMFTTGALEGAWFQITGNNSNTLFLDTAGLPSLSGAGVAANNTFEVIPFWTLNTVFPSGEGFAISPNPFSPSATLFFTDDSSPGVNSPPKPAYLYYDGSLGGDAGWYESGKLADGLKNDTVMIPDTYYIARIQTTTRTNFLTGAVAMNDHRTFLARLAENSAQDNFVSLSFPIDTSLIDSGLHTSPGFSQSPNPFSPTDILFFYDQDAPGYNKPPKPAYFYYDGSLGGDAGWYENGNLAAGLQNTNVFLKAGQGYRIRKGAGPAGADFWIATPSYAPN